MTIPELEREKELNLRLNKNLGEWDTDLLKEFDEAILSDTGFTSEELDEIFLEESAEKPWDLKRPWKNLVLMASKQKSEIFTSSVTPDLW